MTRPRAQTATAGSKEAARRVAPEKEADVTEMLKRCQEANLLLSRELDAYRLRFFSAIGGGINCEQFDLVIICRKCKALASPIDHVCSGR
jgi:hypothetical protein